MASNSLNTVQLNNALAKRFYEDYKSVDGVGQTTLIYMGFFQNVQAVTDLNNWNTWANSSNPAGVVPSITDAEYKTYFNTNSDSWRNKLLYIAGCTGIKMVEKDAAGSIIYGGQKWEEISSFDENENTVGDEPRYIWFECDLKFFDDQLAVNANIGSGEESIITGLVLYKCKVDSGGAPVAASFTGWTDVNYDSGGTDFKYKTIDSVQESDVAYDPVDISDANLVPIYQNTFSALERSDILNTRFSIIIEF